MRPLLCALCLIIARVGCDMMPSGVPASDGDLVADVTPTMDGFATLRPVAVRIVSESPVDAEVIIECVVRDTLVHRTELYVPALTMRAPVGPDQATAVHIRGAYVGGGPIPPQVMMAGTDFAVNDVITYTIPSPDDECPADPQKLAAGVCGCGAPEADTDADGMPDCIDSCPHNPDKTSSGLCGCEVADTDTDGDGAADCLDHCPLDPDKIILGACGCGVADDDKDLDGLSDCLDNCPDDPEKYEPGLCGCGLAESDTDADGMPDCLDQCPTDPDKADPGVCGCGSPDRDADGNGIVDCTETGGGGGAPAVQDCNNNGIPDECDIDCGPPGGTCDIVGCGYIHDDNSNGVPDECEIRACCISVSICEEKSVIDCLGEGGTPQGLGTSCATTVCN